MIKLVHIEDDSDIREIVFMALSLSGHFDIVQYPSGEAALDALHDDPADVLLLDIMMPGLSGYETLTRLRAIPALQTVPAVFMTAYTTDPILDEWCRLVDVDVIRKPINPLNLADQILRVLDKMRRSLA